MSCPVMYGHISLKLKTPHEAVDTIKECFSDLQTWMINHN